MLLFATTTDKLKLTTSGSASIDVVASYIDNNAGAISAGNQATNIASATTTDILGAPAASTVRNLKSLFLRNNDASAADTLTFVIHVGSNDYNWYKMTLGAGQTLIFIEGEGFELYGTDGLPVPSGTVPMTVSVLTTGTSATYTTPARCRAIQVTAIGGGGAGGGAATATSSGAAGAGGGSGSTTEKLIVNPAATYTYTIGAGGTAGTAGNNPGNAGGDTTFGTVTGKGGSGGAGMAAGTTGISMGGAGGVVGSGGDTNYPGQPGEGSQILSASNVRAGAGGPSTMSGGAAGRTTQGAGNAGTANGGGGGGGGACVSNGGAVAGGAGGSGVVIVVEYY